MKHSCYPHFRWVSTRGGYNLNTASSSDGVVERESITMTRLGTDNVPSIVTPISNGDVSHRNDVTTKGTSTSNPETSDQKQDLHLLSVNADAARGLSPERLSFASKKSSIESPKTSSLDFRSSLTSLQTRKPSSDQAKMSVDHTTTVSEMVRAGPDEEVATRKEGVIAQATDSSKPLQDIKYTRYEKDSQSSYQIKTAVLANDFLKNLMDDERLSAVVEAMSPQNYAVGSLIVREGESGSHLFVSAEGQFEVVKGGVVVKKFGPGEAFGELAILYKAKRFASIKAATPAKVWVLERRVFQKIMVRSGRQEREDNIRFLSSVPILQGIHEIELAKISEFLKREFFSAGTAIVRQGERGDKFYIIRGGAVEVTQRDGDGPDARVALLARGDYFGEQALLHEDRRLATVTALPPGVECLTLDRGPFTDLLGNLKELKAIRHTAPRISEAVLETPTRKSEYDGVKLNDLEIVGTLGVGGFGRVELVQNRHDRSQTFALKCLKKVDMVQQQQQEHAYNEKHILMTCNSPFICRLYKTFKDNKYLYFLMEPVLGGDVWTALQKARYFNEATARFMVACVVEAFEYMHAHDIIYRDLKPENLMLDGNGYVKLVDFGFAKQITAGTKTWTFAGTPEYVAPEIVLNKGHDRAIDYWALGVFAHELLAGKPPFRGADHMKTYTLILRGIDAVPPHPRLSKAAHGFIRRLCRPAPAERLGYLKNGVSDIKNHKWFLGFEWDKLREFKLKAPLVRPVSSNTDLSNFEKYPKEKLPPDETSGWDANF